MVTLFAVAQPRFFFYPWLSPSPRRSNVANHPPKLAPPPNKTLLAVNEYEGASSVAASAIRRNRKLTFADRVAYQRAIEEVYWQHRIWPKANPGPKPPLDKVMSQAEIERKVEDYLRNSQALEDYGKRRSLPTNCRPRWSGSPVTLSSPVCCANSFPRSATIRS